MGSFTLAHASFEEVMLVPGFAQQKLPEESFNSVIAKMADTFAPLAREIGRELEFYSDYHHDWAQAFARRWETDQIIVYGGIAAIQGMTEDSLVLSLCHELGHLYGGLPYHDSYNRLSVEGQADYWAANFCFPKIATENAWARTLAAGLVITSFFADNRGVPHPGSETPDYTQVDRTLMTHPGPQCRLDTFLAGASNQGRPACWYFAL